MSSYKGRKEEVDKRIDRGENGHKQMCERIRKVEEVKDSAR